jgi:hypothetical protein
MTGGGTRAALTLPDQIGCRKMSKVQSEMLNTWPESTVNLNRIAFWDNQIERGDEWDQLFGRWKNSGL